jgi:hypothetical protein
MRFSVLFIVLLGVAAATAAASTKVAAKPVQKDIITDILGLFDWALGLLETFGFNIMDILGQFLPAELMDILQLLQDIGIIPIAKQSIVDQIMAAIQMIMDLGMAAFDQLIGMLPAEILSILEMLFDLGAFPGSKAVIRQSFDEWIMALMDVMFQLLGDTALDFLTQLLADFGIPADFVQILWDLVIGGFPAKNPTHAVRVDIIDWAIQMLTELGLQALVILAEFIPADLLSILIDLVLGGIFPA